jgi:transcriptional regulator
MADQLAPMKGTLDTLVLKALSWEPMHGFEITTWLESQSGGALGIDDSALYQALDRMEERGLVKGEWGLTGNNRRARYYRMTAAGRTHLRAESAKWARYADVMTRILAVTTRAT